MKKWKGLNLGLKMPYLGIFWLKFLKKYCHIWNQQPRISQITKCYKKTKMSKFGIKNAWFEYFGARISESYCHIWNQHPQICRNAKLGPKMPYLGIFGIEF